MGGAHCQRVKYQKAKTGAYLSPLKPATKQHFCSPPLGLESYHTTTGLSAQRHHHPMSTSTILAITVDDPMAITITTACLS